MQLMGKSLLVSSLAFAVVYAGTPACCQEFQINVPDSARKAIRQKQEKQKAQARSGKKTPGSVEETVDQIELYMYSHTRASRPLMARIAYLEETLFGVEQFGDIKERIKRIQNAIKLGRSSSVRPQQSAESTDKHRRKLLKSARKLFKKKRWQKASDRLSQVLMLNPSDPECMFKKAECDFHIYSQSGRSRFSEDKLRKARKQLEIAKKLYILKKDTKTALKISKLIDSIDKIQAPATLTSNDF